jgi:type II toxin-antitoxin system toxin YafQ
MKDIRPTGKYLKDLKLAQQRGYDLKKLEDVLDLLRAGAQRGHALKGRWQGYRDRWQAVQRMNVRQRELSDILRGRLEPFSVDQLVNCARRLEHCSLDELLVGLSKQNEIDWRPPVGREVI